MRVYYDYFFVKGGIMSIKNALCLTVAVALIATGCGKKKKKDANTEFTQMPTLSEKPAMEDTTDIFDEFYDSEQKPVTPPPAASSRAPMSSSYETEFVEGGRYVVQVSTVASQALAESNAANLKAKGYPAYVAEVQNPTPELIGTYYRVRIAAFSGISKARQFGDDILVPAGYEYWVDNRSNDNVGVEGYGLGTSTPAADYNSGYSSSYDAAPAAGSSAYSSGSSEPAVTDYSSSSSSATTVSIPADTAVEPAAVAPAQEPTGTVPAQTPAQTQATTDTATPAQGTAGSSDSEGWTDDGWGDSDW